MDCKTHADSVLAKLMRFRPKPQLPPHARQQVLSETYLQNIDSLTKSVSAGRRENTPFEEDDSNMDVDGEQETKGSFEGLQSVGASNVREKLQNAGRVEDRVSQHLGTSVLGLPLNEDSEVSMQRASFGSDKVKSFRRVKPHSFAHTQLVVCSKSSALKSLDSHFDKKDVPIPRRFHRALDNRDDLPVRKTLSTASSVGANWRRSSCGLRSKRIHKEVGGMKNPKADAKSRGAVAEQVVGEVQHSAWYEYSSKLGSYSKNNQNSATECGKSMHGEDKKKPSRSSFANPFTSSPTGKSRRFTMHRDWDLKPEGSNLQESIVLREDSFFAEWDSERGQSIFMPHVDSKCINLGSETSSDIYKLEVPHLLEETSVVQPSGYSSDSSGIEILSGNEDGQSSQHVQHRIHGSDFSRKSSTLSKQWINSSSALDVEVIDVDDIEEDCLSRQMNQQYEFSAPIHDDGDSTSDHFCTPRQKFRDDALMPSHFAETEKECLSSSIECYDVSPDSVLEYKELIQDAGSTELKGLDLQEQLHYFSNEPFESNSEGLGMMVSSDGDSDDGFLNDKHIGDEEMMSICGTRESRDFSYVVDVLSLSGPGLLSMDALDPHVFDVLERKYGKQTSWTASDRKLLFDRINSSFTKTFGSCTGPNVRSSSVAKRFLSSHNLEGIELWTSLINEERRLSTESTDHVIRKEQEWLALGEETDLIVKEIEEALMDELVSEMIGMQTR